MASAEKLPANQNVIETTLIYVVHYWNDKSSI